MRADVTAEHLTQVVRDIAVIDIDDGVAFNLDTSSVQEIRERADYPGLRVRVAMSVGPWQGIAAWDVSTGEPIAPWPTRVTIDRILGEPITLLGYAPETIIAEKGVTSECRPGDSSRLGAPSSREANTDSACRGIDAALVADTVDGPWQR